MKLTNRFGIWMFLIFTIILFSHNVSALGITPARKTIDYKAGESYTVEFSIVNNKNKDMNVAIFVEGDLADRIELSESYLEFSSNENSKSVRYSFTIPQDLIPGLSETRIIARELPTSKAHEGALVTATVAVTHQLHIMVPYPGKYATIEFTSQERNME